MTELKTESESKVDKLYVAFDIETKGAGLQHDIIQIGVAWGVSLDKEIKTASFCFKVAGAWDKPDSTWEKRCWDEFWSKHLDVLKRIEAAATHVEWTWKSFHLFVDNLEKLSDKVKIVSDNPAYDIERIDYNLYQTRKIPWQPDFGGRLGVRYTTDAKYRSVSDPSEQIEGLPKRVREEIFARLDKHFPHTHWAPDDARRILAMHFMAQEAIKIMDDAQAAWDKFVALTE